MLRSILRKAIIFTFVALLSLQYTVTADASWGLQRFMEQQNNPVNQPATPKTPSNNTPTEVILPPIYEGGQLTAELVRSLRNQQSSTQPSQPSAPTPTNPPAQSQPVNNISGLSSQENSMLQMVNAERSKHGLKPLQWHSGLASLARVKSQDIVDNNYFSHTSPTLGSFYTMVRNAGIPYRQVGENLAMSRNAQSAFYQFMGSSGHKQNILSSHFTHIGIGIVPNQYGVVVTQLFIAQ